MQEQPKNMTALVSAFARAYHAAHAQPKVFDDTLAGEILSPAEMQTISESMAKGAPFFCPGFAGTPEEALEKVVETQLAPSPLGRAAFCENALQNAVRIGARQYLILAAGYDTFCCRQGEWARPLQIFELDLPAMQAEKKARLAARGLVPFGNAHFLPADFSQSGWSDALRENDAFSTEKITFCSLLGLVYYLPQRAFSRLLQELAGLLPHGSALAFDYPDQDAFTEKAGERAKRQALLAGGAGENMTQGYSTEEMEGLLGRHGFLAYEHLRPEEITARFFAAYNQENPLHRMEAFDNVNYCLAVKE